MSYHYSKARLLEGHEKVGSTQCVALVRFFANAPAMIRWREGVKVFGNNDIAPGTAIATFVNGRYPNRSHGNHAAFYLSQNATGIWVMDQWASKRKPTVSSHFIPFKKGVKSSRVNLSDDADAYAVIE